MSKPLSLSQPLISLLGISKSQEDPPQLGCNAVAQVCPQGAGEVSSASEYFSCVSSPRKLIHGGKGAGILECKGAWLWSRDT